MKHRKYGRPHVNRWITRFMNKRYRKIVKYTINKFLKTKDGDLHLPQWKDINDPWFWD